jgi:hypothetical protein
VGLHAVEAAEHLQQTHAEHDAGAPVMPTTSRIIHPAAADPACWPAK